MARNDEGEFELVLGNRQLLSGFFIVVILFGVFFTMGYIVGRHSAPASISVANAAPPPESPAPSVSSAGPPPGQAEVIPAEQARTEPPHAEPPAEPPTATHAATAPPETPRVAERRAIEPRSSGTRPAEARPAAARSGSQVVEPAPGSYLQVSAPKRTAAEGVVESLKNKGITAVLAPGPNEETVRVLVGPLDSSTIGKMRVDLESAGFKPFPRKY